MNRLVKKTALITGGRQGIGRGIVDRFVDEGAQVITCGRGERPKDLAESVIWQSTDVADKTSVDALLKRVTDEFERLDILVNNAGVQLEKSIGDTTDDEYEYLMRVNAKGVFLLCRDCLPLMSQGGSIINIGSIAASIADHGLGLYNASKAFVQGLTRSMAVDHGPDIRCNAIAPGWIMTAMADDAFALAKDPVAAERDALARHPAGRMGRPADIANLAVWLASDEAEFATGQVYTLDGGMTVGSPLNPGLF